MFDCNNAFIYSEVPNRRACSLRFFKFSFHPARNFSCNKQKILPCLFINLLSEKARRVEFFCNQAWSRLCALFEISFMFRFKSSRSSLFLWPLMTKPFEFFMYILHIYILGKIAMLGGGKQSI